MRTSLTFLMTIALVCLAGNASYGDTIQKEFTFQSGTTAKASEVNKNFDDLFGQVNKIGGAIDVDASNRVGIGTASPGEKLSVSGTIQSIIGGFKFPDGTMQSTAFSGNADTVDNMHASDFAASIHTHDFSFSNLTGTATDAQIPDTITIDQATDADTVDGEHAASFASASHAHNSLDASDGDPANAVFVNSDGYVGIGTNTPTSRLTVHGSDASVSPVYEPGTVASFVLNGVSSTWTQVAIISGNYDGSSILNFGDKDNDSIGRIRYRNADNSMIFYTNGSSQMTIDADGNVGIGTSEPSENLVVGTDLGSFSGNRIAVGGTADYPAVMIGESSNERGWMLWSTTNNLMALGTETAAFKGDAIYLKDGNVGIGTSDPAGKLDVNGKIYQRGSEIHADYVFEPEYELESIEEHADFMWTNKHLKALPKGEKSADGNEVVEIGSHRRGIVEELEKAHIYIEQLHNQNKELKTKASNLEDRIARLEALLAGKLN